MSDRTIELPVTGMTCVNCARSIEAALGKLTAVRQATVNFPASTVQITFDQHAATVAQLEKAITDSGFQVVHQSHSQSLADARRAASHHVQQRQWYRFWLGLTLTVPVFMISMGRDFGLLGHWAHAAWVNWLLGALATPVQFVVGAEYYANAWQSLKNRFASMDVLVSIGASAAYFFSAAVLVVDTFGWGKLGDHVYFETSATIITLILLGRIVESGAQRRTGAAIEKLVQLQADSADVLRNLDIVHVPIDQIQIDDCLVVKPGQRVPLDGLVKHGSSTVDESLLTGESLPVPKSKGDAVLGGTLNQQGLLHVTVTRLVSDTALARIVAQVQRAQASKAPVQQLADRISNVFVPIVLVVAAVTLIAWWYASGSLSTAMFRSIAVLIISCPCALGLATPLAVMVGMGRGAEMGILFKSSLALQTLHQVQHIVFDKTGTLTTGQLSVTDILCADQGGNANDSSRDRLLYVARAVEQASEHPIARAVVEFANRQLSGSSVLSSAPPTLHIREFLAVPGCGAQAQIDDRLIRVGTDWWIKECGIALPEAMVVRAVQLENQAKTVLWISSDDQVLGLMAVADVPKADAAMAIRELKAMSIRASMLTGDNARTANAIATEVGIQDQDVAAQVLPGDKANFIARLQRSPAATVAMVGDGINDAPALVQADIGIALETGADIALESADVALMRGDLIAVPKAVRLSRVTMRVIKQNLFWAFAYNVALIPIAAGVLASFSGLPTPLRELHPILAALAMVLSDLIIVLNALRLRKIEL
ncbi:MAG: copper-translocating P-type ATPase [Pirellulaceae bacterium]|nr:copper-translocating P-type ATPase [Pirellulaceae bacterium]